MAALEFETLEFFMVSVDPDQGPRQSLFESRLLRFEQGVYLGVQNDIHANKKDAASVIHAAL